MNIEKVIPFQVKHLHSTWGSFFPKTQNKEFIIIYHIYQSFECICWAYIVILIFIYDKIYDLCPSDIDFLLKEPVLNMGM